MRHVLLAVAALALVGSRLVTPASAAVPAPVAPAAPAVLAPAVEAVPLDGARCGDGKCQPPEDCKTCPQDCGGCCGNQKCEPPEDCNSCPQDCGKCK